jgi:hypothetical protein
MSLPSRPEPLQVRTGSWCETLQRRLRVKWRRISENASCTPLWLLNSSKRSRTALFQQGFATSEKRFIHGSVFEKWAFDTALAFGPASKRIVSNSRSARLLLTRPCVVAFPPFGASCFSPCSDPGQGVLLIAIGRETAPVRGCWGRLFPPALIGGNAPGRTSSPC